jgi:hypothetical protein
MKTKPTKVIKKDARIINDLNKKQNQLINKFKEQKYHEYFSEAKQVMFKWQKINPKEERQDQHQLSLNNQNGLSDYTIIDIEYEVSTKSAFACTHIPDGKDKPKKPRFDIIAINKEGKLCVIELKKGVGALKNTSGLKEHWECYKHSIGKNTKSFKEEMQFLLQQKQELNLVDKKLMINESEPEFMFAYAYHGKYNKVGANIHCITIKNKSYKLLDL